jgi:hypothetical protein
MAPTFQPPLQTQQRQIHVRSYDDLVNALGRIIANYSRNSNIDTNIGYEIVIADSFSLPRAIKLQEALSGVRFTSLGMIPLFPKSGIVDALFEVRGAKSVVIDGIYCADNPETGNYFRNFIKTYSMNFTSSKDAYLVCNNTVISQCLFNEDVECIEGIRIVNNIIQVPENGIVGDILVKSDRCIIQGNRFAGQGCSFQGEYTRIADNDFNDGDVFTTGSGNNPLSGNTRFGGGSSTGLDPIGPSTGGGGGGVAEADILAFGTWEI